MSARASDTVFWLQIPDQNCEDYIRAAEALIAERFDVVCFQHEFGIFGGEAGSHIVALLVCLEMPVVTTLHAVLAKPNPAQGRVLTRIIEISAKVVVMAEKGRSLLRQVYGVQMEKIDVISDGILDIAFSEPDVAKAKLGFGNRSVILTFGLLSPNKGIEIMIVASAAAWATNRRALRAVFLPRPPLFRRSFCCGRHGPVPVPQWSEAGCAPTSCRPPGPCLFRACQPKTLYRCPHPTLCGRPRLRRSFPWRRGFGQDGSHSHWHAGLWWRGRVWWSRLFSCASLIHRSLAWGRFWAGCRPAPGNVEPGAGPGSSPPAGFDLGRKSARSRAEMKECARDRASARYERCARHAFAKWLLRRARFPR